MIECLCCKKPKNWGHIAHFQNNILLVCDNCFYCGLFNTKSDQPKHELKWSLNFISDKIN